MTDALHRDPGRRLGDVFLAVDDDGVAAGAGAFHLARRRAVPAATVGDHRLRHRHSAAAVRRRPIPARWMSGIRACGRRHRRIAEPTFQAKWDQAAPSTPTVRNTGWVSIGYTGFSHAPIVQVTVAQQAIPEVELISIAATSSPAASTSEVELWPIILPTILAPLDDNSRR